MSRYDLTDFEWRVIEPLLPNKPRGVPRVDDRRVLNGIFWVLRSGAPWRDLGDADWLLDAPHTREPAEHRLLVMAESDATMRTITGRPVVDLFREMNRWTVESARRFVVAMDDRQDRFVRNRFGNSPKQSLTANLGLIDQMAADGDWLRRGRSRRLRNRAIYG